MRSAVYVAVILAACTPSDREATQARDTAAPPSSESVPAHQPGELVAAATDVVEFLRSDVPFSRLRLADTVTLRLGPEGGGTTRRVAREQLREPSEWAVTSESLRFTYPFAPPPSLTSVESRVGRYMRCTDHDLSATDPELAALPHVGMVLSPPNFGSCLQTWNLTVVFDAELKPPTVVAVIYDQFEW